MEVTAIISETKIRNIAIEEAIVQTDRIQGQVHQLNQRIIDMERVVQTLASEMKQLKKEVENGIKRGNRLGNRK